jgi:hypothetical protein
MKDTVVNVAAELERFDPLHEARLLILLFVAAGKGKNPEPVDGIIKLAKMDFLLRYPNVLERALNDISSTKPTAKKAAAQISESEKDTIEGRMIRFRFGPWDNRYRRWLSILAAKELLSVAKVGRTVQIQLSEKGRGLAAELAKRDEFADLAKRADLVRFAVGNMPGTKLMKFVYRIAPEIVDMKWGDSIKL